MNGYCLWVNNTGGNRGAGVSFGLTVAQRKFVFGPKDTQEIIGMLVAHKERSISTIGDQESIQATVPDEWFYFIGEQYQRHAWVWCFKGYYSSTDPICIRPAGHKGDCWPATKEIIERYFYPHELE